MSNSVLFVDDDGEATLSLVRALKVHFAQLEINAATSATKAKEVFNLKQPAVVVLDLCLDATQGVESGFALLSYFIEADPSCRVIVLTGHSSSIHGIRAMNLGAANFLEKPANVEHLSVLIADGIQQAQIRRENSNLKSSDKGYLEKHVIGVSKQTQELHEAIRFAAATAQAVLITGETGTGKGVCARAIHALSLRAQNPFVRYQPSFATADLVQSELFGHTKGSFTGADKSRLGLIAEAGQGTLFLDEIDELPLETQVALLGVLQEKVYRPLGSNTEHEAKFRLIAASNANIDLAVSERKLRLDLLHRMSHLRIDIIPLRNRPEDIPHLANAFLAKIRLKESLRVSSIDSAALDFLCGYDWPGNIRELEAKVESAAYRANFQKRTEILAHDFSFNKNTIDDSSALGFHAAVENFKLKLIRVALDKHQGNQVKAAEELGLDRTSLRRILKRN